MRNSYVSVLIIILGNVLYALTVRLFLIPAGLITGGSTGIALFVHHLTGMSTAGFVFAFNLLMLGAGYLVLGRKFAMTTVLSTFVYPAALHVFELLFHDLVLTEDPMICTIFSGLGIGISLAMVIREGASTGGMDIPPLILNRLFHFNVSVMLYLFDCIILVMQAFHTAPGNILYGILLVLIYSLTLDRFILIGTSRTEVKIISRKSDEIRKAILSDLDRGVTVLHGEGGYSNEQEMILLTVISNRQLPAVETLVRRLDEEAFLIVSRVTEVRGRGFTLNKEYL
ncbi:MAG: YitT family protein [Solobacterium sp.]|nr:YitT family protein [Solobacterium sp.]